jgi:hypothetical protein
MLKPAGGNPETWKIFIWWEIYGQTMKSTVKVPYFWQNLWSRAQKNNYRKQKENMGSFPLHQANTIEAPHTRVFVWETVTSNCAATQ